MNKLTGEMTVTLALGTVNDLNALIERDTAKAPRENKEYDLQYCPACDCLLLTGDKFCRACGQRIDTENVAL